MGKSKSEEKVTYLGTSVYGYKGGEMGELVAGNNLGEVMENLGMMEGFDACTVILKPSTIVGFNLKYDLNKESMFDRFKKTFYDTANELYAGNDNIVYTFYKLVGTTIEPTSENIWDLEQYFDSMWESYLKERLNKHLNEEGES